MHTPETCAQLGCADDPNLSKWHTVAPRCTCAKHDDGSVTTFLCSAHADQDPCLTMSQVTGKRRAGTIRRGVCTACGHRASR